MDAPVQLAVISALTAVTTVALKAAWDSWSTTRTARSSEAAVAKAAAVARLTACCRAVQLLRDRISTLVNAPPRGLLSKDEEVSFAAAQGALEAAYADHHALLEYPQRRAVHDAKALVMLTGSALRAGGAWNEEYLTLSPALVERLSSLRERLTSAQNDLLLALVLAQGESLDGR